ncbi:MAG TPA: enoyl-CoA hydratase/isomerase family protein [Pseudonocardiaceae bacterium]|jgi:hypothetical protein|nr:enoyl-CoA hydratase/isomerase family protein [Pseudonocardiaceae bacterium]
MKPVTVVDLDAEPRICDPDRILIGIATRPLDARRAAALDVTIVPTDTGNGAPFVAVADPRREVAMLRAAAEANPQAALALVSVLRAAPPDVTAALDLESFAYSTLLGGAEFATWLAVRGARPLPPPAHEPVLVERGADELRVTLNRPERRNAYGRELRDALVEALRIAVLDDTVTRVVLRGAGPSFCSGGDLAEFGTTPDVATAHFVRVQAGASRLLHQLADRVTVHVHGGCVGAGVELPAFADHVIARPDTTFRLPEVGMGLLPGAGGTVSLPRRIGRWRTLHLALSGRPIDASTALSWGLVDAVE